MRTVLVGNRKLARTLLEHALEAGWNTVGAVVPEGELARTQANFVPFDELVDGTDCTLHRTDDINSAETLSWLEGLDPDYCICGGWSQIIRADVLNVPRRGFLGFHSSRLPEGRGGAPVNWSLIDGDEMVWLSFFYYATDVDAGDVIARRAVEVKPRDDIGTVFDRLAGEAVDVLVSVRDALQSGTVDAEAQALNDATYRPRRAPQDGLIDWDRSPDAQYDWVRAQTDPYPGAYTFFDGHKLTVWTGEPQGASATDARSGEVLSVVDGEGVDVCTGDGVFRVQWVEPEGRPARWADEYARVVGLSPGDDFGRQHAPADWVYTGVRRPAGRDAFDTNLEVGTSGRLSLLCHTGAERNLSVSVLLNDSVVYDDQTTVDGTYAENVEYSPTRAGTHTLKAVFTVDGEDVDRRFLKVFAHGG